MKKISRTILIIPMLLFSAQGYCCISCNNEVQQAIKRSFLDYPSILLGFGIVAFAVVLLSVLALRNPNTYSKNFVSLVNSSKIPLTASAIVLGIGIGGFIDGIILHQILQWHEMLSNKIPPTTLAAKSVNMFWDGLFHLFTLLVTITGIFLLWKVRERKSSSTAPGLLAGGMMAGWGIFNLLEGTLNHHILNLHNIRESSSYQEWWNYGFLLLSFILVALGMLLVHNAAFSEDRLRK